MRIAPTLLILLLIGACGSSERSDRAEGIVRLTYWPAQNEFERLLANELAAEWNEAHPGVQVTVQPIPAGQSSEEVLLAAIVAGTTPDICSNIWPGIVNDFVRADGLVALDGLPGFDSLLASRIPAQLLDQFRSGDGRLYQMPWKTNPIMMQYNKQIFREAGFDDPPGTYSEFLDAAGKITRDLDGDGQTDRWIGYRDIRPIWWQRYFDFYALYIGASNGKTFFSGSEPALDSEAATEVFDFFAKIYERGYFPITTYQGSAFVSTAVATEFVGPWNISWLQENAPDMEYGYAPLPVPDDHQGPRHTYGDYKNIVIFSDTRHPEEAWKFLQFLVTKQADLRLLELTKQIPVRRDLLTDSTFADFFERQPLVVPFAEQAPYTRGVDAVPSFQEILDAIAQEYEAAGVYRVRSPEEATEEAIERIRVIHEWSR